MEAVPILLVASHVRVTLASLVVELLAVTSMNVTIVHAAAMVMSENDVDECNIIGTCYANAACEDTVGSFICTCQSGYAMVDGTPGNCENINECMAPNKCNEHATCDDTVGT